jgi:hypothetical protein
MIKIGIKINHQIFGTRENTSFTLGPVCHSSQLLILR